MVKKLTIEDKLVKVYLQLGWKLESVKVSPYQFPGKKWIRVLPSGVKESRPSRYPLDYTESACLTGMPRYDKNLADAFYLRSTLPADKCWVFDKELSKLQGTAGGMGSGTANEWPWQVTPEQSFEAYGIAMGLWQPYE